MRIFYESATYVLKRLECDGHEMRGGGVGVDGLGFQSVESVVGARDGCCRGDRRVLVLCLWPAGKLFDRSERALDSFMYTWYRHSTPHAPLN
jgi:hypothetical protein